MVIKKRPQRKCRLGLLNRINQADLQQNSTKGYKLRSKKVNEPIKTYQIKLKTNSGKISKNNFHAKVVLKKYFKKAKCKICNKHFSGLLSRHMNSFHKKQKKFQCDICKNLFTQACHLKIHRNSVHLKLRPHQCDLCEKRFTRKTYLKKHKNQVHLKSLRKR
jgi:uncharacterized Zn-finger protein